MKKQLFILALAGLALVSCDPLKDKGTFDIPNVTAESMMKGATFAQFDGVKNEDGSMTYTPCEDGNYIEFSMPSVNAVTIYYLKADGSESTLDYGRNAGIFFFKPTRGSDPVQTVYFKYIDGDLKETVASKEFTLQVAQELAPGDKLLCSNNGSKKWYWSPSTAGGSIGAVWGNAGWLAGEQTDPTVINGGWWGCGTLDGDCADKFDGQLQHSAAGKITGEEYSGSYMVFNEDGSITKYSPDGTLLGTGSYKLDGYKDGEQIGEYYVAKMQTSEGAILWPYAINMNGFQPTEFYVGYLSVDHMILQYAAPGTAGWAESTWWSFENYDDAEGFLTSGKWGWYPTVAGGSTGAVWGNAGYLAGEQSTPDMINGGWWGCGTLDGDCADKFDGQLQHSAAGAITGEEYNGSYMTFDEDGTLCKFDPEGKLLGTGSWAVEMKVNEKTFSVGTLSTSEGAILWPYAINQNGFEPTDFAIGYLSGSNMILIYAAPDTGGWAECTWWSFGTIK